MPDCCQPEDLFLAVEVSLTEALPQPAAFSLTPCECGVNTRSVVIVTRILHEYMCHWIRVPQFNKHIDIFIGDASIYVCEYESEFVCACVMSGVWWRVPQNCCLKTYSMFCASVLSCHILWPVCNLITILKRWQFQNMLKFLGRR